MQLEEAKALIAHETLPHARLAFILLDNAAEILMFRNIEVLLAPNPTYERILKRWDEILKERDDPQACIERDRIARQVVPKKHATG